MIVPTPSIEILLERWVAAFNSRDLDAHMDLYTEDATLFGAVDELQVGRSAIRSYFGARGPDVRVMRYPLPRIAIVTADTAVTAGHVDFQSGAEIMPYRITWMLVRKSGNWQIFQHHGSPRNSKVPIKE